MNVGSLQQATGCGKTHTISGTEEDPGIIYLTMAELFTRIEEKKDENIVEVSLSFLEIYNEEIRDLLVEPGCAVQRGGLAMREDKSNRVVVSNLTELRPNNAEEVKEMVLLGNSRRTQSPTHANETSSRSHAVLQINVSQAPRTASTTEERTMATLSIIDLAGSERASATRNMGERMVEGANINKSLLALGNCINALCESGNRTRHVPYRNSKLTRLLKFSLGGNCKTVMIVCVAPTSLHFEDTQNTLKYANRAKDIKTKVSRNYINVDRHVAQYVEAINRLNCEVAELKAKLAGKVGGESEVTRRRKAEGKAEMERLRLELKQKVDAAKPLALDVGGAEAAVASAKTRVEVVRPRLVQLREQAQSSILPSDLQAELDLLEHLICADEQTLKSNSEAQHRLLKAGNAIGQAEGTIRSVVDRSVRSDRMDDVMTDVVRTDVKLAKAELEGIRHEVRGLVMKEALERQVEATAGLVGVLARCTVMMRDAAFQLQEGGDINPQAVVASLLQVADSNDEIFTTIVGQSTAGIAAGTSSLHNFTGHAAPPVRAPRRSSVAAQSSVVVRHRRRSSNTPAHVAPSPAKVLLKHMRSPRKAPSALRRSISIQPTNHSMVFPQPKDKKQFRWKDQAGEGSLDDAGRGGLLAGVTTKPVVSSSTSVPPVLSEAEWEDVDQSTASSAMDTSSTSAESSSTIKPPTTSFRAPPMRPFSKLDALAEVDDETLRSPTKAGGSRTIFGERGNQPDSPPRRIAPSMIKRVPGSARKKRLSNSIGPGMRRRSSLIPQLSPRNSLVSKVESMKSPTKKRLSVNGSGVGAKKPWRPSLAVKLVPESAKTRLWR